MTVMTAAAVRHEGSMTADERLVIFASSLGTVFEWYDFYISGPRSRSSEAIFPVRAIDDGGFLFTLLAFSARFRRSVRSALCSSGGWATCSDASTPSSSP